MQTSKNTDNTDNTDNTEQKIYEDYIKHRNAWINYIRTKAVKKLNDYMDTSGRKFYKYGYLTSICRDIDICTVTDKDLTAKYKKLSLLFHPDKFKNSNSNELFTLINKFYKDGKSTIINAIDVIAHNILELPDISNIITNLTDPKILNKLANQNDASEILLIMNRGICVKDKDVTQEDDDCGLDSQAQDEFISSICYKFYKDVPSTINYINSNYLTEAEFISKIKDSSNYEIDFINYCKEMYNDNKKIMIAISEWFVKENEKLVNENKILNTQLLDVKMHKQIS